MLKQGLTPEQRELELIRRNARYKAKRRIRRANAQSNVHRIAVTRGN